MGNVPKPKDGRVDLVQIRLTRQERRMFMAAAKRKHLTVSAWMRLASVEQARREDRDAAS